MVEQKTGALGIHAIGDAGASNEAIAAYADLLGGMYATVVNDGNGEVKTCRALKAVGVTCIGREKTDVPPTPFNDDDGDHPSKPKPAAWVERFKWRYPDDDIIWTAGNELGTNPEIWQRTCDWVKLSAELYANANHRTCAYNTAVQNPTDRIAYWKSQKPALEALVANNGIVGLHRGEHAAHDDIPAFEGQLALDELEKDIQELQKYGVEIVITELCGSLKPDIGYKGYYKSSDEAVERTERFVALMAKYGVHGDYFTYTEWSMGHLFGFHGDTVFKNGLIRINHNHPVQESKPVAEKVNIVDYAFPFPKGEVYKLSSGETCQSVWNGLIAHLRKNTQWEEAWIEEINGVRWLMRGMDISNFLSNQKTVYALFRDQACTIYGGQWVPETAEIGKVYPRTVWAQVMNADTGEKIAQGSGWDTTYFKVVKRHATWTTPEPNNPVVQKDVIECIYGHDKAAIEKGTGVAERYFYGKGFALVGFIDPHLNVFITHEKPPASLNEIVLSWWVRPTVKAVKPGASPMPAPIPTTGGKQIQITKLPGTTTFRNIRADADANSADLGDMKVGDILTGFVDAPNNGFVHVVRNDVKGWVLFTGVEYKDAAVTPPPVSHDVIYTEAQHAALVAAIHAAEVNLAIVKSRLKGQVPVPDGNTF